jgi:hypothetical protein
MKQSPMRMQQRVISSWIAILIIMTVINVFNHLTRGQAINCLGSFKAIFIAQTSHLTSESFEEQVPSLI